MRGWEALAHGMNQEGITDTCWIWTSHLGLGLSSEIKKNNNEEEKKVTGWHWNAHSWSNPILYWHTVQLLECDVQENTKLISACHILPLVKTFQQVRLYLNCCLFYRFLGSNACIVTIATSHKRGHICPCGHSVNQLTGRGVWLHVLDTGPLHLAPPTQKCQKEMAKRPVHLFQLLASAKNVLLGRNWLHRLYNCRDTSQSQPQEKLSWFGWSESLPVTM